MINEDASGERITMWECIGCGKIEAPRPCIGVCQDRKVEFVHAARYEEAIARVALVRGKAKVFKELIRRLANMTPRDGEWERSYRVLQNQARRALGTIGPEAGEDTGDL